MTKKRANLEGQRFGKLTVIRYSHTNKDKKAVWICECDCGKKNHQTTTNNLTAGRVNSCGCGHAEKCNMLTFNGKTIPQISKETGISTNTLYSRVYMGWQPEDLNKPARSPKRQKPPKQRVLE